MLSASSENSVAESAPASVASAVKTKGKRTEPADRSTDLEPVLKKSRTKKSKSNSRLRKLQSKLMLLHLLCSMRSSTPSSREDPASIFSLKHRTKSSTNTQRSQTKTKRISAGWLGWAKGRSRRRRVRLNDPRISHTTTQAEAGDPEEVRTSVAGSYGVERCGKDNKHIAHMTTPR